MQGMYAGLLLTSAFSDLPTVALPLLV
jgi:hypothetical protein